MTPGELPSSITGQRDGALALLVDQRDQGGPFRDFRCFDAVKKANCILTASNCISNCICFPLYF